MNPVAKAALSVLRLVAFGCIILSLAFYSSDCYLYLAHKPVSAPGVLALKGAPFLIGIMLYWKARAIAERFTRDLD